MIIVDSDEAEYVQNYFKKHTYGHLDIRKLGILCCRKDATPLYSCDKGDLICLELKDEDDNPLNYIGYYPDPKRCNECTFHQLRQVADFTNDNNSFAVERKRVDDFVNSLKNNRLYKQLNKLDKFYSGHKYLILEGDPYRKFITDSVNPFGKFDNEIREFRCKSPIRQAIELLAAGIGEKRAKAWVWSIVRECASREIGFMQTKSLDETFLFIKELDKGCGKDPKIRAFPKKIAGLSIEANMLCEIRGIGKVTAEKILKEYKSLPKFITWLREQDIKDLKKSKTLNKFIGVFV